MTWPGQEEHSKQRLLLTTIRTVRRSRRRRCVSCKDGSRISTTQPDTSFAPASGVASNSSTMWRAVASRRHFPTLQRSSDDEMRKQSSDLSASGAASPSWSSNAEGQSLSGFGRKPPPNYRAAPDADERGPLGDDETMRILGPILVVSLVGVGCASQQATRVPDHVVQAIGTEDIDVMEASLRPAIEEVKRTYPGARGRLLAGLPGGSLFFVTIRLPADSGSFEQVFVLVESLDERRISGRVASEVLTFTAIEQGQSIEVAESDIIDWTIVDARRRGGQLRGETHRPNRGAQSSMTTSPNSTVNRTWTRAARVPRALGCGLRCTDPTADLPRAIRLSLPHFETLHFLHQLFPRLSLRGEGPQITHHSK